MSERNLGLGRIFAGALDFASRNLTVISVGVLVVGVTLIAANPVREMLSRRGEGEEPATPETIEMQPLPGGFSQGTGGGDSNLELLLERAPAPFTIVPNRQRDEVISYVVQSGDTVFDLADRYGISMETIFWANAETLQDNVHLLIPGVEIYILPVSGVYHRSNGEETIAEIAARYFVEPEAILDAPYNELPPDSGPSFVPPLGMRLVVPGGEREAIDFAWAAPAAESATTGSPGTPSVVFAPGHPGSCNTPIGTGAGTGAWVRPINNYNLSQGFHYAHNGVDLASVIGEPVYAADSGVVVFAGWNDWGYGNLVAINHGAWTTLYAHMNYVSVRCGQTVSRGTPVGGVGNTGNSSGPHLHFEMRYGLGLNPDNPAAYIPF